MKSIQDNAFGSNKIVTANIVSAATTFISWLMEITYNLPKL
ncbi:hypothetical protein [Cytobacillus praedii]